MIVVKRLKEMNRDEIELLRKHLSSIYSKILPYHMLEYANVLDEVFGYENFSLVAFNNRGEVVGYLPQWKHWNILESVPWRDKGGPTVSDQDVIKFFILENKKILEEKRLKGFIWKDFTTPLLQSYSYYVNVDLDLSGFSERALWKKIKNRTLIRQAVRNKVRFVVEQTDTRAIEKFYSLFVEHRKNLGIPVYQKKFFDAIARHFEKKNICIYSAYVGDKLLSSLLFLLTDIKAIYAYGASSQKAYCLRAADFVMWGAIRDLLKRNFKFIDFGADSPLQEGLIKYKLKFGGSERKIHSSFYGNIREIDHNKPEYSIYRKILKIIPLWVYKIASSIIVR